MLAKYGKEKSVYSGKIFEVTHQKVTVKNKEKIFEKAIRSPGVRLIIVNDKKEILITKEFRTEIDSFDYRLPGGKVFDKNKDFKRYRGQDMSNFAKEAAIKECKEETGLIVENIENFLISKVGSTLEWDLHYFIVDKFKKNKDGQDLGSTEIITPHWMSFSEVIKLCKDGKIKEHRSMGVLFKYFLEIGYINS